jgi:hypothetical protein
MAGKSPTARTLAYLRQAGWPLVQVVEHFNFFSKQRNDLFGFADVLAVHPVHGHLYVQVTSGTNVNARLNKMRLEAKEVIEALLETGARVEVHGWRKVKVCTKCKEEKYSKACTCKGSKSVARWRPRIINVTTEVMNATQE